MVPSAETMLPFCTELSSVVRSSCPAGAVSSG